MKSNKLRGGEYVAPALEEIMVAVESGFEGSEGGAIYGLSGYAGQGVDVYEEESY